AEVVAVRNASDIETLIESLGHEQGSALVVPPGGAFPRLHQRRILELGMRHRVAISFPDRTFAEAGGLLSYGPDYSDLYLRAAGYVSRILGGERAGDLPIQIPAKFELVINLKTANGLGLTVPATMLARADEVIE